MLCEHLVKSIKHAKGNINNIEKLDINGLTSPLVKSLLNNLLKFKNASYLEIGINHGATFIGAIYKNTPIQAVGIDNYSEIPKREQVFKENCKKYLTNEKYQFYKSESFSFDKSKIQIPINIYFYDGDHSELSQKLALGYYYDCLADEFIYLVDDWNWEHVRKSTMQTISALGLEIKNSFTLDGKHDKTAWWNGLFACVLKKHKSKLKAPPRKAVLTIVRDEKIFLPIWLNYYSQYFDWDDIWVIDNNTIDGSTKNLPCNVFYREQKLHDPGWVVDTVNWFQRWMMDTLTHRVCKGKFMQHIGKHYDMVLYTDVDEIMHHPSGLDQYMKTLHKSGFQGIVRPGNSIGIHHFFPEPDLDLSKPVLKQRHYCVDMKKKHGLLWQKPNLTTIPVKWTPGFHEVKSSNCIVEDPLYTLIHLHEMDHKICEEKHRSRLPLQFVGNNAGGHTRIVGEELKKWFDASGTQSPIVMPIPEHIKKIKLWYSAT